MCEWCGAHLRFVGNAWVESTNARLNCIALVSPEGRHRLDLRPRQIRWWLDAV